MWECRIDLPVEVRIGPHERVDTGSTIELILACEPDESVGDTTYWISGVGVEGRAICDLADDRRDKATATYWLARNHPLHEAALKYARTDPKTRERLNDLWSDWLDDKPARRADARRA